MPFFLNLYQLLFALFLSMMKFFEDQINRFIDKLYFL